MADPTTVVRFVDHHDIAPQDAPGAAGGFMPGDVVGLPAALARALIDAGKAVAAPIAGLVTPAPANPDPAAALAAASAEVGRLGTGPMNPAAAATLAAEAPAHFAGVTP